MKTLKIRRLGILGQIFSPHPASEAKTTAKTMKSTTTRNFILATGLLLLAGAANLKAASGSWTGAADSTWAGGNWSAATPGTGDTATFNGAGNAHTTIDLGGGVTILNLLFDSGAAAYTIGTTPVGGQTLTLNDSGTIRMTSLVSTNELFNSQIVLGTDATAKSYTFVNNSASTLTFAGNINGGTGGTAGLETLTFGGTGNIVFGGNLNYPAGTGTGKNLNLVKTGTGTFTVNPTSNVGSASGSVTINSGTLAIDFSNAGANGSLLSSFSPLTLSGGTLNIKGNASNPSTQTFGGTTYSSGGNVINMVNNGSAPTLALGGLTWSGYATVAYLTNGGATTIKTTTVGAGPGAILWNGFDTYGSSDWAVTTNLSGVTTNIVGLSSVSGGYVTTMGTTSQNQNMDLQTSYTAGGNVGTTTIRFNTPTATTASVNGKWIVCNAVLVTPKMGANNCAIGNGNWYANYNSAAATEWVVQNNTNGYFGIGGLINDKGAGGALTYVQSGSGTVVMPGTSTPSGGASLDANQFTGQTYLNGGQTVVGVDSDLGLTNTGAQVNLNGGTIVAGTITGSGGYPATVAGGASVTLDNNGANKRNIVLGNAGGGLAAVSTSTLTVDGVVSGAAGTGPLIIGIPASSANGNTVGLLPGTGSGTANTTAVNATGTVTLSGVDTYTGDTIISSGTLKLSAAATINNTTNIIVGSGATYDVSSVSSYTLGASQNLMGSGTVNGSVSTVSGSGIYAGTVGTFGTNTFNNNLTLATGAVAFFDVSTNSGITGPNDEILVSGNLTLNSTAIHVRALSSSVYLSPGDHLLFTNTGTFTASGLSLVWDVAPANFANYILLVSGKGVYLHDTTAGPIITLASVSPASAYPNQLVTFSAVVSTNGSTLSNLTVDASAMAGTATNLVLNLSGTPNTYTNSIAVGASVATNATYNNYFTAIDNASFTNLATNTITIVSGYPTGSASASPNPVGRGQPIVLTATLTPNSYAISNVTVDVTSIGGSSVSLVLSNANVYTNTVVVQNSAVLGSTNSLPVTFLDTGLETNYASISLVISGLGEVWNGSATPDNTWVNGGNWTSGLTPQTGDFLTFAGTTELFPKMENNYSIASLTFGGTAGSFDITNDGTKTLTLTGAVTNNSSNPQTLSVPISVSAVQTINTVSTNIMLSNVVSGSGGLNKVGAGTLTLAAANPYSGSTIVGAGAVQLNNPNAVSNSTVTISAANGLTFNSGVGTFNLGNLAGSANEQLDDTTSNAVTLVVGANNGIVTNSGVLSDAAGAGAALVKVGTGSLVLSGQSTFTGNITVSNGTLVANGSGAASGISGSLGNSATTSRSITIGNSGTLDLTINNVMGQLGSGKNTTPTPVIVNGGTLRAEAVSDLVGAVTLNGGTINANSASGTLNYKPSAGYQYAYLSFQLGGDVTVIGSTPSSIISGTYSWDGVSMNNATNTFNVADVTGDANVDLNVSATLGNENADFGGTKTNTTLVKTGAGTMLLSALNFYGGGTVVSAGTLIASNLDNQTIPVINGSTAQANSAGALGKPGTTVTLGDTNTTSSPTLLIAGAFTNSHPITIANQVTSGTYTLGGSVDANAVYSGLISLSQPLTISQVANTGANALKLIGGLNSSNGLETVTFAGPGNINVTNTAISNGSGTVAVNVTGGKVTLSAVNTYSGNTIISAGTLALNGTGSIANSPNIVIGSAATLNVSGLTSTFALGSSQTLSNSASTAVISGSVGTGSGTVSLTYASGTPALTVTNGTLTLSGTTIFNVNNTGSALTGGKYKLVSTNAGGAVTGILPAIMVGGNGTSGVTTNYLMVSNSELYLVVDHAPVANPSTYYRPAGYLLRIPIAGSLATNWSDADSDPVALTGSISSTNGASVSYDSHNINYSSPNNLTDQINYTVSDGQGGTAAGVITVLISSASTNTPPNITGIVPSGGNVTISFASVPGSTNVVEWTTNLMTQSWTPVSTNMAGTNGLWQFTYTNPPSPSFFRSQRQP
jgi:autotransporter-associated beta strand protein